MLLTSSQVSFAVSSAIVVFFTAALFLSGYAIQQRTVSNLRAAIRPNAAAAPGLYLPDRFSEDTTELADGTIVVLDAFDRPVRQIIGSGSRTRKEAADGDNNGEEEEDADKYKNDTADEERLAVVEEIQQQQQQQQQQKVLAVEKSAADENDAEFGDLDKDNERPQQQPAPWEVRNQGGGAGGDGYVENPDGEEGERPISRAERRRLIKQEIARLSQVEQPVYYQRRLW